MARSELVVLPLAVSESSPLGHLLEASPVDRGVHVLSSPQRFEGGEEDYDQMIGARLDARALLSGQGAWTVMRQCASTPLEVVLEIGAGSGACSLGLIAHARDASVLVSDTSVEFLNMIQRKLDRVGIDGHPATYLTLAGEETGQLPEQSVDGIVIASALHHFTDWRAFLTDAARILRPGGVLLIQEPFREAYLLLAVMLDMALSEPMAQLAAFSEDDRRRLSNCRESIYFLANDDMTKVGEDKHNFLVDDVEEAAFAAGFSRTRVYRNVHLEGLVDAPVHGRGFTCSFVDYFSSFLKYHHGISEAGLSALDRLAFDQVARLERLYIGGSGPAIVCCVAFTR